MPKLPDTAVPAYRLHKASRQAVVTLDGRDIYLGDHGSTASKDEYRRLAAEWLAGGGALPVNKAEISIAEIVVAHRKHAKAYYRTPDGRPTSEVTSFDAALKPLVKLYGRLPAHEFSPLKLKAVRDEMIRLKWARRSINKHVGRIKRLFA